MEASINCHLVLLLSSDIRMLWRNEERPLGMTYSISRIVGVDVHLSHLYCFRISTAIIKSLIALLRKLIAFHLSCCSNVTLLNIMMPVLLSAALCRWKKIYCLEQGLWDQYSKTGAGQRFPSDANQKNAWNPSCMRETRSEGCDHAGHSTLPPCGWLS